MSYRELHHSHTTGEVERQIATTFRRPGVIDQHDPPKNRPAGIGTESCRAVLAQKQTLRMRGNGCYLWLYECGSGDNRKCPVAVSAGFRRYD